METTLADVVIRIIGSLGFPIFVAVWLLVRTDVILREIRDLLKTIVSKGDHG